MKAFIVKILEFAAVIIGLIAGVFLSKNFGLESIIRGKEQAVTLAMTEEALIDDLIGMPAGSDIPRIETAQNWSDTWWDISCITVEPTQIISTGIAVRHPWVSPYRRSRRTGTRKRAEVTYAVLDAFDEYAEYYLLQLPDHSYILAQMPIDYVWKLKLGQKITLPVGKKHAVDRQAVSHIRDLCEKYHVDIEEGVFYCINDIWNEEHNMLLSIIRLVIAFGTMLILGTVLITIAHKILKVKD